jgi:glycosyltransferase involved in cell wall biosynthesis
MDKNPVLLSICCITYNHENYISQAIEGFLAQKTSFNFEIIIHDDASTDATASIVKKYEQEHPNLIKAIYQKENQYSQGIKPWPNFVFPIARGKYIALCEGDDYWTDPYKLQKQVDFLEANPEYVLTADNAIWHDLGPDKQRPFSTNPEKDVSIGELLRERQFATAAVVFRNLGNDLLFKGVGGDTVLWCHLTKFGKLKYFPRITSVYQRHELGVVSSTAKFKWAKTMEQWNRTLQRNHPALDRNIFKERNYSQFIVAANEALLKRRYLIYFQAILKCILFQPPKGLAALKKDTSNAVSNKMSNLLRPFLIKQKP